MNQPLFSNRKITILTIVIIVLVLITGTVYFFFNQSNQEQEAQSTNAETQPLEDLSLPVVSSSQISPLSPVTAISPLSPVSGSTTDADEQAALNNMFEEGFTLYNQGNPEKAEEIFNEMLKLDPNNARAYDARGTIYVDKMELEAALADYSKAIELDPLFPPPYYNRGRAYSLSGRYNEALADLHRAFELAPFFFGYLANGNIGLIYHQQGQYDKALEAFGISISHNREEKADVYFLRGETYTALKNYEAAIADYQAAISRFSKYHEAYESLGYVYYQMGQFDQATEALNQALEISPENPMAHFYLALVHLSMDQFDQAEESTAQAMDAIGTLSEEKQKFILERVLTNLETFAQENPDQAGEVNTLINLIPEP